MTVDKLPNALLLLAGEMAHIQTLVTEAAVATGAKSRRTRTEPRALNSSSASRRKSQVELSFSVRGKPRGNRDYGV